MKFNKNEKYSGGPIDESISRHAIKIISELGGETDELKAQIGKLLGRFRGYKKFEDDEPPFHEAKEYAVYVSSLCEKVRKALDHMPSHVEALVDECSYYSRGHFFYKEGLDTELMRLNNYMDFFLRDTKDLKISKGEKKKTSEHTLLFNVAKLIENYLGPNAKKIETADKAGDILVTCGIHHLPDSREKRRLIVSKIEKDMLKIG
jgi:hypothetical protein